MYSVSKGKKVTFICFELIKLKTAPGHYSIIIISNLNLFKLCIMHCACNRSNMIFCLSCIIFFLFIVSTLKKIAIYICAILSSGLFVHSQEINKTSDEKWLLISQRSISRLEIKLWKILIKCLLVESTLFTENSSEKTILQCFQRKSEYFVFFWWEVHSEIPQLLT